MAFQAEKQVVREYYDALDSVEIDGISAVLSDYTAAKYTWRGFHPFHLQVSSEVVSTLFLAAFSQRSNSHAAPDGRLFCW